MEVFADIWANSWFVAIAAFALGLFAGWLVWARGVFNKDETPTSTSGDLHAADQEEADPNDKLAVLDAELKKVRSLLAETESESEAFAELLSGVDEAVKRANGRMKVLLKSIKRSKKND